jgi:hypothetical protein
VSDAEKRCLQVSSTYDRHAFHGAASSLLLKCKDVPQGLSAKYGELWERDGSHASWLEVPDLETNFVYVTGADADDLLEGFKTLLSGSLVEDLIAAAPGLEHDELLLRYYWVAYMTERPDQRVLEFFDAGVADSRENIRLSALEGYNIRRWPEWRKTLERVVASDASAKVRERAKKIYDKG